MEEYILYMYNKDTIHRYICTFNEEGLIIKTIWRNFRKNQPTEKLIRTNIIPYDGDVRFECNKSNSLNLIYNFFSETNKIIKIECGKQEKNTTLVKLETYTEKRTDFIKAVELHFNVKTNETIEIENRQNMKEIYTNTSEFAMIHLNFGWLKVSEPQFLLNDTLIYDDVVNNYGIKHINENEYISKEVISQHRVENIAAVEKVNKKLYIIPVPAGTWEFTLRYETLNMTSDTIGNNNYTAVLSIDTSFAAGEIVHLKPKMGFFRGKLVRYNKY